MLLRQRSPSYAPWLSANSIWYASLSQCYSCLHVDQDTQPRSSFTSTPRLAHIPPPAPFFSLSPPSLLSPDTWPQTVRRKENGQAPSCENSVHVGFGWKSASPSHTHRPGQARAQKVCHSLGGYRWRTPRGSRPSVIHTRRH